MKVARLLARWLISTLVMALLVFGPAGRLDLPMAWIFLAISSAVILAIVFGTDPDLARERRRPGAGGQDRSLRALAGPLLFGSIVVAGLDAGRFGWSPPVPPALQAAALVLFALTMGLVAWSMTVNRFFSPVVRIQTERGHHLITSGPYRFVRHPGYAGMFFGGPAIPLALGSWWGLIPAVIYSALVLRRTVIEDRFLRRNLEGYEAFCRERPYRLAPGIW